MRDAYDMWLATYKLKVADTTLNKTTRFMSNHVLTDQWFKDSYVDEITPTILQQFVNELSTIVQSYNKISCRSNERLSNAWLWT